MALNCRFLSSNSTLMKRIIPLATMLALAAVTAIGHAQTVERTLSNGLKVVVIPDHRAPTVAHMVWYRAGSIDEVNGRTGVAHALEHMMFKGTKTVGPGEFSSRVAALGGRENAFTSRDYTGYFQQVQKTKLADVMALEADRMANLVLSQEEFAKEIQVVMEERRWRTEDQAQSLVYEQLMAVAFTTSPYRRPIIGWMDDLSAMTVQDARDWYHTWYTPSNAVLVVAGDVDPAEVIRLAEADYGPIKPGALPERKPQAEPEQRGRRTVAVKAPADNPYVALGFHVPKLAKVGEDVEPYALELLAAALDADENGRLTRNIVRGSRVANQAGAGYHMTSRGPSLFILDGTPAGEHTTAEVEAALRAEIGKIASDGLTDEELGRIKTQYVAAQIYKRDSIFAQGMEAAQLEMLGFSYADADRILERIRGVSSAQVQAVAKKYFGDDTLTVATLLPQPVGVPRKRGPVTSH